jgi:lipoprotein-releasing system permease protein
MKDAQVLYNMGTSVSGLRLKVSDLYAAPKVNQELQTGLQQQYLIQDWTQQYGDFFKTLQMEKTMMFFILALIIVVAVFNLVSSLVMIVTDKQAEIAILRTLGASSRTIMFIFMVQGCMVGIIGTILGLIGGVILALNATRLVSYIQQLFHVQFVSSAVYLVDYLPSKLEWIDVVHIVLVALALSLIATIYPAWQAARTQPAEALRYE